MHRRRPLSIAPLPAAALACALAASPATAQANPPQQGTVQPSLPRPLPPAPDKPGSPVVEQIVHAEQPVLVVRKQAARPATSRRRRLVRRNPAPRDLDRSSDRTLDRPALAGVQLVVPLPVPDEPPHLTVPMPAYSLDSVVTPWTTPLPPIVCHRTARDPDAPDPHLYRETPVECEPDNP